jgi:hypothetical protein
MPSELWSTAATLLAAVAVHANDGCDTEVPICCAGAVAALGGTGAAPSQLPDTEAAVWSSVETALALLDEAAFDDALTELELDALAEARLHARRAWRVLAR